MSKRKTYTIFLSEDDRIDMDLEFERRTTGQAARRNRFAITYSARIRGDWREFIRYDNFHGFLHRQPSWRSKAPERLALQGRASQERAVESCREDLRRNWRRYRSLMERKEGGHE